MTALPLLLLTLLHASASASDCDPIASTDPCPPPDHPDFTKCLKNNWNIADSRNYERLTYLKDDLGARLNVAHDVRPAVPFVRNAPHTLVVVPCSKFQSYVHQVPYHIHRQCGQDTRYFVSIAEASTGAAVGPLCIPALNSSSHTASEQPYLDISDVLLYCNNLDTTSAISATTPGTPPPSPLGVIVIVTQCDATSAGAFLHFFCVAGAFVVLQPLALMLIGSKQHASSSLLVLVLYVGVGALLFIGFVAGATAPELNRGGVYEALVWLVSLASGGVGVATIFHNACSERLPECRCGGRCGGMLSTLRVYHVLVLGPYTVLLLFYRLSGVCEGGEGIFRFKSIAEAGVYGTVQCPGHHMVGTILSAWSILVFLVDIKAITLSRTIAFWELRVWFCAGIAVFSVSLIHLANAGNMWPNEVGVVDHQHVGLYMVIIIFSGLGIVAQMTKLKKPHWNVPFTLIAICMSILLYFHDPDSHGLHKNLHQVVAISWLSAAIARAYRKHMIASVAGAVAGISFASVVYAHIWMNTTSSTNYLGYLFYTVACIGMLYGLIVAVVSCGRLLGAPIRLGEPIESLEHGGNGVEAVKAARTRGRYEMVGVGGSLGSLEDGEVAGLTTTTNGDESSGGEEEE